MKLRVWIAFAIAAIAFTLVISLVVLVSHVLGCMLQMSLTDELIGTGISIFAVTLGVVLGILHYLVKQKR